MFLADVFLLLAAPQALQPPQLHESVVVTAAAEPIPFDAAARAVWVLTRADIARLPVHSVEDLLRFASSVDVRARGAYAQADVSIRGASFGQTLVLIDGMRINDAQSGHHNMDIPLALDDIERVEVLLGAGSSLFGADAFGGTINFVTRRAEQRPEAMVLGGQHGLAGGRGRIGFVTGGIQQSLAIDATRSSGFAFDRDFETFAASSRTAFGERTRLQVGYVHKDFGAAGFYGPAPSREWTDQTLAAVTHAFEIARWKGSAQALYRTHGDHFLYDLRAPGQAENFHRTHATAATVRASRAIGAGTRVTLGGEAGSDWVRSSNLGDHAFRRGSGFAEVQQRVSSRAILYPGVRYDAYSRFGHAWSPSIAGRVALASRVSARASIGRVFRVPTFTELYYRDPNHDARSDLEPERGWSAEAGTDWTAGARLLARATVFTRRERDVIDWIRPSAAERWRTTNIRRVTTRGIELGVRRLFGDTGSIDVQYTGLATDAEAPTLLLSKYVLEYAPHALVISGALRAPFRLDLGQRLAVTRRNDGRSYTVVDLRASRAIRRLTVFVDAANVFDADYEEIRGVAMPGRWLSAGLRLN